MNLNYGHGKGKLDLEEGGGDGDEEGGGGPEKGAEGDDVGTVVVEREVGSEREAGGLDK